jgi:hypothetical protein
MYYRVVPHPLSNQGLGAMERRNPLPVGRYWVFAFGDKRTLLETWFKQNSSSVHAGHAEGGDATGSEPAWSFYIFNVLSPTPWDAVTFGYPDIAASSVQSSQDTASAPSPPTSVIDSITSIFDSGSSSSSSASSPTSSNPSTPGKPGASSPNSTASSASASSSDTMVMIAGGVVLVSAVAFAIWHRSHQ